MPDSEVIVVGAGVAGLTAARELALAGRTVIVLEAGDRPGGTLRTATIDGVDLDVGAEGFSVARPQTRALIDELGLADRVVAPRRSDARLLLDDGLHRIPPSLLGIPVDLGDPLTVDVLGADAARRAQGRDRAPVGELAPDIALGALVRERMDADVVARLVAPVVGGVHAVDPDTVEAEAVAPGLLGALRAEGSLARAAARLRAANGAPGSAVNGLVGGMTALVGALVDAAGGLGADIRLNSRVRSVRRAGHRWQVRTDDGARACQDLVLALDAPAAAMLLGDDPAWSGVVAPLRSVRLGDVAVVALLVDLPVLDDDPLGSGVLVGPGHPSVRAKALTHASAKWDWVRERLGPPRHVVRLSYGRDGTLAEQVDALPATAAADLAALLGRESVAVEQSAVARWPRTLVRPMPGHRATAAAIVDAATAAPNLAVVGAGLGGNSLAGTIAVSRGVVAQLTS